MTGADTETLGEAEESSHQAKNGHCPHRKKVQKLECQSMNC